MNRSALLRSTHSVILYNSYATLFTLGHFHYFTTTYKSFALAKFGPKNKLKNLFMAKQVEMPFYIFCHIYLKKTISNLKVLFAEEKMLTVKM